LIQTVLYIVALWFRVGEHWWSPSNNTSFDSHDLLVFVGFEA
jgi:hypothetical protein